MKLSLEAIRLASQTVRWLRSTAGHDAYAHWDTWCRSMAWLLEDDYNQQDITHEVYTGLRLKAEKLPALLADSPERLDILAIAAVFLEIGASQASATESAADRRVVQDFQKAYLDLQDTLALTLEERQTIATQTTALYNRYLSLSGRELVMPASYAPLRLELLIRVGLYLGLTLAGLPLGFVIFWLFLGPFVFNSIYISRRAIRIKKCYEAYFVQRGSSFPPLKLRAAPGQVTVVLLSTLVAGIMFGLAANDFSANAWVGYGIYMLLSGALQYYFLTQGCFPGFTTTRADAFYRQVYGGKSSTPGVDENDDVLARLVVRLKGLNQKVDAFVLEAALFGALAFSAFVSIVATDFVDIEDIVNFLSTLDNCLQASFRLTVAPWYLLSGKANLFCLICIETLTCSVLFLAVVASRLRFSDWSLRADTALELARAFNEKEEKMLEREVHPDDPHLNSITARIGKELIAADAGIVRTEEVIGFMRYFRDLGVATFFLVLVTSTLLFSFVLAALFATVFVVAIGYHRIPALLDSARLAWRHLEEYYVTNQRVLQIAPWALLAFSLVLGLLKLPGAQVFSFAAALLMGLIYLIPGFLPIAYRQQGLKKRKTAIWQGFRIVFALGQFLIFLGLSLKMQHLPSANELLIIGVGTSATYFFYGFFFHPDNSGWRGKLLSVFLGLGPSAGLMGLLFRLLRLPGANEMMLIGIVLSTLACLLMLLKPVRALISSIQVRQTPVVLGIVLLFNFTQAYGFLSKAQTGYAATRAHLKIEQLDIQLLDVVLSGQFSHKAGMDSMYQMTSQLVALESRISQTTATPKQWDYTYLDAPYVGLTAITLYEKDSLRIRQAIELSKSVDSLWLKHRAEPMAGYYSELQSVLYMGVKDTTAAQAALSKGGPTDFFVDAYELFKAIGSDSLMHVRFNANHAALGLPPASVLDTNGTFQWVEK